MGQSRDGFHWLDYVVFALVLIISCGIGIVPSLFGGKQKTQGEYFMGNREMSMVPVATSLCLSFISAILILGAPAEMYNNGTQYWLSWAGIGLAVVLAVLLFVPLLYPLKLLSSYEYFELRYKSKAAKILGTLLLLTSQIIYMGIATFSPATALEAVSGFPVWGSILCVGIVATFYTTVGGMKGVIWTAVFQSVIMLVGLVAIVIVGSLEVGGMSRVWEINQEWDRVEFFVFDPNPTTRHTFWTIVVGNGVSWLATYGSSQTSVQRFCSLPTEKKAKGALLLNIIGVFILITLTCLTGVVAFAYFTEQGCDPLKDGSISNSNQVIPYFVMQVLAYPGFPGLFVATLFAGALSTMSSGINAMAAVTWEDLMKPWVGDVTEEKKTFITKIVVCLYGLAGTGMAFAAKNMGGTVLQASMSFTASALSPICGMFLLGGIFPWSNWIGAVVGGTTGLVVPMWLSIGSYVSELPSTTLPTNTETCGNLTLTEPKPPVELSGLQVLYSVSYLWFPAIGIATTVIVGLLVSLCTGMNKPNDIEQKYLMPFFDRMFCCLPEKWLKMCRCGKPNLEEEDDVEITKSDMKETLPGEYNAGYVNGNLPPPTVDNKDIFISTKF